MSIDRGRGLDLELTSTIEVLPLPRWQDIDRRSALRFIGDRNLLGAIAGLLLLASLTVSTLTGTLAVVVDPDGALASRRHAGLWDFSVGLQLALDPDAPYVLELRKLGADEAIVIHHPHD